MGANQKRVAVVGGGISGLGAAYLLRNEAKVYLYEKNPWIGGHSRTLVVNVQGKEVPVDTGFIVYNERNYPLLTKLFQELEVPVVRTNMSFGVSIDNGWLEYSSNGFAGFLGDPRNLIRLNMWKLLSDVLKFNRRAIDFVDADPSLTMRECLDRIGLGEWFRRYYLLPMGGCIWSCPVEQMLEFPAASFIRFFRNHGLLTLNDHPQWYSVKGGSRVYVERMLERMGDSLTLRPAAVAVRRNPSSGGVEVRDGNGGLDEFDAVIFATHPDQALTLLQEPQSAELEVLSAIRYQRNQVVLHTDTSFMPKRRSAWASWVYRSEYRKDSESAISLSYWMNNLQDLETEVPVIVTLNPSREPKKGTLLDRHEFSHPVFDEAAIRAQERVPGIQGSGGIWYCGAWQRNGFHEDGLWSAAQVVEQMGVELPW